MKESFMNNKSKKVIVTAAICVITILCVAGLATASFKYFYNQNKTTVQTLASNEENKNAEKEEIVEDEVINIESEPAEENEENLEEQLEMAEEQDLEEVIEISEEEKQKQKEEEKRIEEEQKKKKEEEAKKNVASYPYWLKVNYTANTVTAYKKDENGNFTIPVRAMICSTGAATPKSGVYRTQNKYRWRILIGNSYGQYSTRITGQILFHSVPYEKQSPDSIITKYYDRLGITTSLGCIRLTVADAKWIYDNCPLGTSVEFYSSSNPGPLGKPGATKISNAGYPLNRWDPTDPDPNNPWRNSNQAATTVEEEKISVPNVLGKTESDAKKELDTKGLKYSVEYKTESTGTDGVVINQSIKEGTLVEKQSKVELIVRKLEEKISVPNVVGRKESDAKKVIEEKGLKVQIEYKEESTGDDGVVITQSEKADSLVSKQSTVKITVRKVKVKETTQTDNKDSKNSQNTENTKDSDKTDTKNNTTKTENQTKTTDTKKDSDNSTKDTVVKDSSDTNIKNSNDTKSDSNADSKSNNSTDTTSNKN